MARKITAYNRFFARHRKAGKTPKQIGVLWKSGKPKEKTTTARAKPKRRSSPSKKVRSMGKNSKMFRTLGAKGAIEDFAWGFGGLMLMGANNPVALPAVRLVQGIQGHVFGRTGKGRLVYAIIDIADLIIAGQASVQSVFDSLRQLKKIQNLIPA